MGLPCKRLAVSPPFGKQVATSRQGFPGVTSGKKPACQHRRHQRLEFSPWVGKIPWRGYGNSFQYSCLENPMDRGAWWATVHGVTKSWAQLKRLSMHTHKKLKWKQMNLYFHLSPPPSEWLHHHTNHPTLSSLPAGFLGSLTHAVFI